MATVRFKLAPFMIPRFAIIEQPPQRRDEPWQPKNVPLEDLEPDTLSEMCDAFRAQVFAQAQKIDPRIGPDTHGYGCPLDGDVKTAPCADCDKWDRERAQ